jgi:uncharacterized protein
VSHLLENLIVFGRLLRRSGLPVGTDRVMTLTEALQFVDLESRADVHAACRSVLVSRQEDFIHFDQLFNEFWRANRDGLSRNPSADPRRAESAAASDGAPGSPDDSVAVETEPVNVRTWSNLEAIASKDFAVMTDEELATARAALAAMDWRLDDRRTRRWNPGHGSRVDIRRAMARSLRTAGEIITLPRLRRRMRARPIVLLCDVSGSMELYSRTLLQFAHSLTVQRPAVEAFLFATRLTRITHELRAPKPDAAIAAVSQTVRDWSGGTRIGESLRTFHQRWRRRALRSESIVILISDGWDRGDPHVLRDQIARLQRSCHRLIWLNPLIGSADYAPLTRGLQAALPFVDDFLPVRTLRDVRDLALHLGSLNHHGHLRHLHLRGAARTRLGIDARSGGNRVVHPGM